MRAILTYHSIDPSGSPVSLDVECFRRHVRWLASGSVRAVALSELLELPPTLNAVAVTFDDGFANFAESAWPLLRDHAIPATLFVVTAQVGKTNSWGGAAARAIPVLPLLAWDALGRMVGEGLELGSHSRTHPHLEALPDTALAEEVAGSRQVLEQRIGRAPSVFCYPYGTFDGRVVGHVAQHYRFACTTELAALDARPDPHRLPRLDAYYYQSPGRLESWGSAAFRAHLWLRSRARRVKQRVSG